MKKTISLFIAFLFLIGFKCFAQDKFTTYDNAYFEKTFDIQISTKDKVDFTLWIDAHSFDKLHKEGGIEVSKKQYDNFLNALKESKLKYVEWIKTAKENNVKELDKEMTVKCKFDCYFEYGDWNFQRNVTPNFRFKILPKENDILYLLIMSTGELQSSSNQFMKVDGFALVFSSESEIDDFINVISLQKINDFLNKPKAENLFK